MLTSNTHWGRYMTYLTFNVNQFWEPASTLFRILASSVSKRCHPSLIGDCLSTNFVPAQHLEHIVVKFRGKRSTWSTLLSRSLYRSHVLTTFLGPVLGAMMKQVCWHSPCHCFLMLALLRPSRRTRQNRSRQQSAASGC